MRAFLLGLLMLAGLSATVLAIRLAGVYVIISAVIRVFFPNGWVADYGPPGLAILLAGAFLLLAQDPAVPPPAKP